MNGRDQAASSIRRSCGTGLMSYKVQELKLEEMEQACLQGEKTCHQICCCQRVGTAANYEDNVGTKGGDIFAERLLFIAKMVAIRQ